MLQYDMTSFVWYTGVCYLCSSYSYISKVNTFFPSKLTCSAQVPSTRFLEESESQGKDYLQHEPHVTPKGGHVC